MCSISPSAKSGSGRAGRGGEYFDVVSSAFNSSCTREVCTSPLTVAHSLQLIFWEQRYAVANCYVGKVPK